MNEELRTAFNSEISELNLEQIVERLSTLDVEVREATEIEAVELRTEQKKMLLERKSELEALEERKQDALAIQHGAKTTITEERGNEMPEVYTVESAEYRSAFFKQLLGQPLTEVEERAIATSGAGGAIPTETSNKLVKKMLEVAPLLSEITLYHVAGNVTVSTYLNPDDAYLHTENATITASTDTLAKVTLAGYEFTKLISISATVKTMAINDFETWLTDMIAENIAEKIEYSIIYGSGTNEPGGLASITWTASTNLISTTASITYKNVCDMMTYPSKGLRKGAKWLCNSAFPFTQLAGVVDSQNRPIFVQSMAEGVPSMLMGRPVLISDEVNDDELYFGQFDKIHGNLSKEIEIASSEQSSFAKAAIDYRGLAIFDCKVAAPRAFAKFKKN